MSNFVKRDLPAYVWTRCPAWLVLGLGLFVTAAALIPGSRPPPAQAAYLLTTAVCLILEFRLWDDLCDRKQDCLAHPERVLCRTQSLWPFVALVILLAAISFCAISLLRPWWSPALLAGLYVLLGGWYACRDRLPVGPIVNYHVVLLKYPAFVLVLGANSVRGFAAPLFASAAVVYLGLCVIEVLHDARLRRLRAAWICLAVEAVLLVPAGWCAASWTSLHVSLRN